MSAADMTTRESVVLAEKYRVLREIGHGGVGVVYEVEHLRLRQRFAVKVLDSYYARDPEMVERFEREARAMASLKSPHVAQVIDVDLLGDGTPYIVMELLEGRDMAAVLRDRGSLPLRETIDIVTQACRGLELVHAAGIVHRDIKPANLFLVPSSTTPSGVLVKVMDFGISKVEGGEEVTRTGSSLGTPAYMSPEQVRSTRDVDARTDLWAMGVILFRTLAGALPFDGEGVTGMSVAIVNDPPKSLRELRAELPDSVLALVDRLLDKDRETRLQTVTELLGALGGIAAELEKRVPSQRVSAHTIPADDELGAVIDSYVRTKAKDATPSKSSSVPAPVHVSVPPTPQRAPRGPLVLAAIAAALLTLVGIIAAVLTINVQRQSVVITPAAPTEPTATANISVRSAAPAARSTDMSTGPAGTLVTSTPTPTPTVSASAAPVIKRAPRVVKPKVESDAPPIAAPAGSVPTFL